ncbi:hypothetical protein [uncultured Desulfovibrio sp.]|uniref:hypothetical protein n=1 Tax=uncultured Desulfovibrio sp. TaxID=167968 RepID=UPI001AA4D947|nr:hypothetical protein [uncultured Desulfovibrio sp.]CAI3223179.1 hypothetical protein DWUX_521 [Desulfovibrio diazotrophicus]VVU42793.1 hypothetical protein DWUX_139 [Desulfovibrio diazotrophicus]
MRWYAVDDLTEKETARLQSLLTQMGLAAGMDGLYWLPPPDDLLSPLQREHAESCGPYVMGLELEETSLRLELLVRARGRLRCDCVHYAGPALREHMIAWLERLLNDAVSDA